jgi:phage terminase large subunit-like protein
MKREQRKKGTKVVPPWEQYVSKVLSGEIVTGNWVRLACERHKRDMERQRTEKFPYYFSPLRANHIINFFDHLRHSQDWFQGHGGDSFKLELWQCFILGSVFGWLEWNPTRKADPENDNRRFSEALVCVGRKNGKTTLLGGVGLYGLLADHEQGAQVYCFATKEEQAQILWNESVKMRAKSPVISENCKASKKAIFSEETESKFTYLGSDSKTQDGLNPSLGLCDELHAHPNRSLYDVIKSGQGSRRQPLLFTITTAGFAKESFCRTLEEMGEKILSRIIDDEHFF